MTLRPHDQHEVTWQFEKCIFPVSQDLLEEVQHPSASVITVFRSANFIKTPLFHPLFQFANHEKRIAGV